MMVRRPAESSARDRTVLARQLQRAVPALTKSTLARLAKEMPWYADLPAEQRALIGMVVQAGYHSFIAWYRDPDEAPPPLTTEVFGSAPRSFAGVVTLQQTVAMIRLTIEVAEEDLVAAVAADQVADVRVDISRYGRELAFATADVYARAAELRGAWDARLESLVVDSVMRGEADESTNTRAAALGWERAEAVTVLLGRAPDTETDVAREQLVDEVREAAAGIDLDSLAAIQGDRLVVLLGGVGDPVKAAQHLASHFGSGPIVVGPVVTSLDQAYTSAAEAIAGLKASVGWKIPDGPVPSSDLLPERALTGDALAVTELVEEHWRPLADAGPELIVTLTAFLDLGGSIEATARALFVHPNTVRYRLRRVTELTGRSPQGGRDGFILRTAIILGRLSAVSTTGSPDQ